MLTRSAPPDGGDGGGTTGAQRALLWLWLWLLILAPQGESGVSSVAETPSKWGMSMGNV